MGKSRVSVVTGGELPRDSGDAVKRSHDPSCSIIIFWAEPTCSIVCFAGIGSFQHLSTELLRLQAGINLIHVPFKGGGPAMIDVIAGNTQITMGSLLQLVPHVQGNRLRLLAVGSAKRDSTFSNTPTVAETVPGYDANNGWGILAPAGVTPAVVRTLEAAVKKVVDEPDIQKKFESQGAEVSYLSSAAYGKFIRAETAKWSKVVRDAGIKAE